MPLGVGGNPYFQHAMPQFLHVMIDFEHEDFQLPQSYLALRLNSPPNQFFHESHAFPA